MSSSDAAEAAEWLINTLHGLRKIILDSNWGSAQGQQADIVSIGCLPDCHWPLQTHSCSHVSGSICSGPSPSWWAHNSMVRLMLATNAGLAQ